jgi:hypothetical protein
MSDSDVNLTHGLLSAVEIKFCSLCSSLVIRLWIDVNVNDQLLQNDQTHLKICFCVVAVSRNDVLLIFHNFTDQSADIEGSEIQMIVDPVFGNGSMYAPLIRLIM